MAANPSDRKYTKTHEWALAEGELVTVGITDFAQQQLSDITYVELPANGKNVAAGKEMSVLESIKAAADVYAPVSGTIAEVNARLADDPGLINRDPFGAGWLVKIKPANPAELAGLMAAADYEAQAGQE